MLRSLPTAMAKPQSRRADPDAGAWRAFTFYPDGGKEMVEVGRHAMFEDGGLGGSRTIGSVSPK